MDPLRTDSRRFCCGTSRAIGSGVSRRLSPSLPFTFTPPSQRGHLSTAFGCGLEPRWEIFGLAPGFTLLEVLVALTIFAMAAVMLASSYLNVLNAYEVVARGVQISEDFAFARQQVLFEPDRKKVEEGGEFETSSGRRAKWKAEIESTTVADVFRVTFSCEVTDPGRPEAERQTQTFILLRPTWVDDAAERGKLKEDAKTRILELQQKQQQGGLKR